MKKQMMLVGAALTISLALGNGLRAEETTETTATAATPVSPVATETTTVAPPTPATPPVPEAPPATPPVTEPATPPPTGAVTPPADSANEISYNDTELTSVVRTLAARAGLNLIVGEEVTGKVTVNLKNVSYEEAMRMIVESKGYAFIKDKNVIKVKSRDALEAEPVQVQVFTLNYAKAEEVQKSLQSTLSKQGKMQINTRSNALIVMDTPSNLSKVALIIQAVDTQTPQVMIEAKFVETTKNPLKALGVDWSGTMSKHPVTLGGSAVVDPTTGTVKIPVDGQNSPNSGLQWVKSFGGGALAPWTAGAALLDVGQAKLAFSFLSQDTDTELLASPRVVTTDNSKAKISISTQVPIPEFAYSETKGQFQVQGFTYKDIGIILNVTPHINKNEFITLDVAPETSERSSKNDASFQGISIPAVDTRTAQTTVLIKSGNTLAIGGLMRTFSSDSYSKVPILGDIPGLGVFFRNKSLSKETRNLLIFVTPTIVGPEGQTGFEQYYGGLPHEEAYTNDKWLPKDNAKPRNLFKKDSGTNAPPAKPTQNFQSR